MLTNRRRVYDQYSSFQKRLTFSKNIECVEAALISMLPVWRADAVSVVAVESLSPQPINIDKLIDLGPERLWDDYCELCRSNKDPLSRILRLSPHPVAFSDLQDHARLANRSSPVRDLFHLHGLTDVLALPVLDRQASFLMVLIAGQQMNLSPTSRHLMVRVATDAVTRLQHLTGTHLSATPCQNVQQDEVTQTRETWQAPSALPRHMSLTNRQLEIAAWLVAGKTDWEIGEILEISPKTVNFHVENIKRTYGVKSRNQFVAAIVHDGGLSPTRPEAS